MKTTQMKHVHPLSPFGGRRALFFLLLLWGLGGISYAQTTVTLIGEDFTESEVTFSVTMSPATPTWVFVDYTTNPHNPESMSRATFTSATFNPPAGGTFSASGTSTAEGQGFWLTNSATVTAKLKNVSSQFSWCAYAINVPPNAEVKAGGGYTLRGTRPFTINNSITVDSYDFGSGTCIATITDLTYNPAGFLRTPPMTVTATAPATVCAGTPITFTATATGGTTTDMTYTWKVGAAPAATTTANTYSPTVSAGSTYSVTVTNANGCVSAAATGTITVHAVPTVITTNPAAICGTGAVTLTATASGGTTTAMTYTWKVGAAAAQTTTANTYSPTVSAGSTYSVTVTNANGCVSAAATGTITVAPALTQTNPTAQSICYNATATFNLAVASGGSGTISYTWQQSGNGSSGWSTASGTNNAAAYTTTALTSDTWYRRIASTTCGAATTTAAKVTVRTNFSAGSITAATVSTTAGTAPTTNPTNATEASGGDGSITYEWRRSGYSIKTLTSSNTSGYTINSDATNYSTAGTYYFTRYAKDGACNTTFTASSGQYTLTVGPSPPPSAGTKTYTCGTQTWSEPIKIAACNKSSWSSSTANPECRSNYYNSNMYYYYNWAYVNANKGVMCPAPWHVPTRTEFLDLISCMTLAGTEDQYWPETSVWGGARAGKAYTLDMYDVGNLGAYGSTYVHGTTWYFLEILYGGARINNDGQGIGLQIRCVL
jgi:uncharacterized protein (TIGR02145 family)